MDTSHGKSHVLYEQWHFLFCTPIHPRLVSPLSRSQELIAIFASVILANRRDGIFNFGDFFYTSLCTDVPPPSEKNRKKRRL